MSTSLCSGLALLAWLAVSPAAGPARAERSSPEGGACPLTLDGKFVDKLVLEDKQAAIRELVCSTPKLSLPAGEYRVRHVIVKGGYSCNAEAREEWFTLSPDRPYRLSVGAPLKPHIRVTRQGSVCTMDYRLEDAGGRNYVPQQRATPPHFAVQHHGREIGSGSFEYG